MADPEIEKLVRRFWDDPAFNHLVTDMRKAIRIKMHTVEDFQQAVRLLPEFNDEPSL